jgi:hypothetical protein
MARRTANPAETKEKKGRQDFPKKDAKMVDEGGKVVKGVDNKGLLLVCPKPITDGDKVVYEGFVMAKHKPLKKADFAGMADFLEFQGFFNRQKAAKLIAVAEDREAKAERIRKYGDEETRRKVEKLQRLKDKLAAYEEQLKADGVEVPEED